MSCYNTPSNSIFGLWEYSQCAYFWSPGVLPVLLFLGSGSSPSTRVLEVEKLTPTADLDSNLTPSFLAPTGAQRKRIPVVCGSIHSKVVMRVLLYATWGSKR